MEAPHTRNSPNFSGTGRAGTSSGRIQTITEFAIRTIRDIDVPVSSPLIQDIPHISDVMRRLIHANDTTPLRLTGVHHFVTRFSFIPRPPLL